MYAEDFFFDDPRSLDAPRILDRGRLEAVRREPEGSHSDIEVCAALARLIDDEFTEYGTSGNNRLDEDELRLSLRVLRSILARIGLQLSLPFSDFSSFRSYWVANDGYGSWQARRAMVNKHFDPLHETLARMEDDEIGSTLVSPATSHPGTGWTAVDVEIRELRRHFQASRTEQDYRNVGNDCVAVTERLSEVAYEPSRHLRADETEPPVAKTKQHIERFVEDAVPGAENAEVRKVARAVIELAQAIKHQRHPTRRDAGIAADSVIQLANILRRLDES